MFVISKKTDKDWDDLSLNFRNSPYITLDQDMLSVDIFEDDISAAYYTVFIFSLVIHMLSRHPYLDYQTSENIYFQTRGTV